MLLNVNNSYIDSVIVHDIFIKNVRIFLYLSFVVMLHHDHHMSLDLNNINIQNINITNLFLYSITIYMIHNCIVAKQKKSIVFKCLP